MRKRLEAAAASVGTIAYFRKSEYRIELAFWLEEMENGSEGVFSSPDNARMGQALKLQLLIQPASRAQVGKTAHLQG